MVPRSWRVLFFLFIYLSSCKEDPVIYNLESSGYPKEVGKIILSRCAIQGCHTSQSAPASSGLNLETMDDLFKGNNSGAVVIPFSHTHSTLFQFVNTYPDLGPKASPTMPLESEPLSVSEVQILKDWINKGAPDVNGNLRFPDKASRKKYYFTNQGCDVVSVMDAETSLLMRIVNTGQSANTESPHLIKVSPDKRYWYVIFNNGNLIQKFDTENDRLVGSISLDPGLWNTMAITADSRYAYAVDWSANGKVFYIDLYKMEILKKYAGSNLFIYPHGIAIHPNSRYVYVTAQSSNFLYKIDVTDPMDPEISEISLGPQTDGLNAEPHEVIFSKDGSKYFVTCQRTNEVRMFDPANDALLRIINVGVFPQEMAVGNELIGVTCTEDPGSRGKGSVYFIEASTGNIRFAVPTGGQPHGIALDDSRSRAVIAFRNIDTSGPVPHHSSECGGRNGYMNFIDLKTGTLSSDQKTELSVDPYSVDLN